MAEYLNKDELLKVIDKLPLIAESKIETTLSGDIKLDKAINYLHGLCTRRGSMLIKVTVQEWTVIPNASKI